MKVTVNQPPPVVRPPTTYTLELSESEMNDLQTLADWNTSVAQYVAGRYGTRGMKNKLALKDGPTVESVENTLQRLWDSVQTVR